MTFQKRPDLCVNNNDIESLSIEILNSNSKNVIVNVSYRQPAGNINVFEDCLKKLLSTKNDKNKAMYITGDLNLNLLDYKTNAKVKSYLNLIFSHSFVPLINKPTRISRHNATIIDHILTNDFLNKNYTTGIVKTDITDHFPVFFVTETELSKTQKNNFIFKRVINDESLGRFNEALTRVNWHNVFISLDPNIAYNEFLKVFQLLYNKYFPKRRIKIKYKNLESPWITRGIIKSSKRKQRLYEKYLKRKTPQNDSIYKNYKRLFETIKQKSKVNYFNERLNKYQNNIKKTWDVIKEIIGSTKSSSHHLPKKLIVNVGITREKQIAESFNKYFVSVGPKLAASIPISDRSIESFLAGSYQTLNEIPLTDKELQIAFLTLKSNKSPGYDDINPDVVKFVFDAIVIPVKHIF